MRRPGVYRSDGAKVAAADPVIFRRKGGDDTAAVALVWIVAKANDAIGISGSRPSANSWRTSAGPAVRSSGRNDAGRGRCRVFDLPYAGPGRSRSAHRAHTAPDATGSGEARHPA